MFSSPLSALSYLGAWGMGKEQTPSPRLHSPPSLPGFGRSLAGSTGSRFMLACKIFFFFSVMFPTPFPAPSTGIPHPLSSSYFSDSTVKW